MNAAPIKEKLSYTGVKNGIGGPPSLGMNFSFTVLADLQRP